MLDWEVKCHSQYLLFISSPWCSFVFICKTNWTAARNWDVCSPSLLVVDYSLSPAARPQLPRQLSSTDEDFSTSFCWLHLASFHQFTPTVCCSPPQAFCLNLLYPPASLKRRVRAKREQRCGTAAPDCSVYVGGCQSQILTPPTCIKDPLCVCVVWELCLGDREF